MKTIDGNVHTVSEVLKTKHYGIDYYQFEYRWQRKHARVLIADLPAQSLQPCRPSHPHGDGLPKTVSSVIFAIRE